MISLQEAQAKNFSTSTRTELRAYAEELGIEGIPDNADAKMLKKMVCNALGMPTDVEGRGAPQPKVESTSKGGDGIMPSYNLTPNGIWGGRRHRLSIPRPEGVKIGAAEGFIWDGKHPYYIAYDEVDSVPEPIYNIIATNKRRRVKAERPSGGEIGELTTRWDFDSNAINYLGVDDETKRRAGSLLEWYQAHGSAWVEKLTVHQMRQVAQRLEVPSTQYMGDRMPPRALSDDEMRNKVMEFLFGYADAVVQPNKEMEL
jgi:hypothetical protein